MIRYDIGIIIIKTSTIVRFIQKRTTIISWSITKKMPVAIFTLIDPFTGRGKLYIIKELSLLRINEQVTR
ncbi:MAG: hypothetical protein A1D16_18315 [Flavihumibacter sp. CACIAM 22H1]|nr:MAG: hypothetical protein A1D16_18315 [Flavihumibacter sp. CACIAM 22H1]